MNDSVNANVSCGSVSIRSLGSTEEDMEDDALSLKNIVDKVVETSKSYSTRVKGRPDIAISFSQRTWTVSLPDQQRISSWYPNSCVPIASLCHEP